MVILLSSLDGSERCLLFKQRFRDDREILVSNDMPLAISRRLKNVRDFW